MSKFIVAVVTVWVICFNLMALAQSKVPIENPVTANGDGPKARHCPPPEQLIRDPQTLRWYTDNGWKSGAESFSDKIDGFVMARWVGVNVGKVICLYQGNKPGTFPVALERSNLMEDPTAIHWGRYHDGYKDCVSSSVWDCPFFTRQVQQPLDLYEEIRSLKKSQEND